MNLNDMRDKIDELDLQILKLFEERMDVCRAVSDYKKEHSLPIFQPQRETELIEKIQKTSNPAYKKESAVLFTDIMDISKTVQRQEENPFSEIMNTNTDMIKTEQAPRTNVKVACPGVPGSYSHMAANKVFTDSEFIFCQTFEQVFDAVDTHTVDFGIVPIDNSTAGSVREVYELIRRHKFYINFETEIKIEHCLAAKKGTRIKDIKKITSHEQALAQSSEYIKSLGIPTEFSENTAISAKYVSESSEPAAAVCSELCAGLYDLEILDSSIQNNDENYTRFICISKKVYPSKAAESIAVSLSIPNTSGSLYRLLTKFAVIGVNMTKIESKPMGNKNFDTIFYIDFTANILDASTTSLLNNLSEELLYFNFLGNYIKIR